MADLFAVDGALGAEKLAELLAVGHETARLDFKQFWDLSKSSVKHRLDLVTSVAAFSNTSQGGYLVVGVDGQGSLDHDGQLLDRGHFDSATLQDVVRSFVSGDVRITSRVYELAGRPVALIFVAPSPDRLPVVFTRDGILDGKAKFHRGQIYVRRGTQCVAAEHTDWQEILARHTEETRRQAHEPTNEILRRLMAAAGGTGLSDLPLGVDFGMDLDVFGQAVHAARPAQFDPLRRLVRQQTHSANWEMKTPWDTTGASALVDRLLVVGAHGLLEESEVLSDAVFAALVELYQLPIAAHVGEQGGAKLWRTVASAAVALGGLAVRQQDWASVRKLALPDGLFPVPDGHPSPYFTSWIRHAVTMAARAEILVRRTDGSPAHGGLIRFARATASRVPLISDDVRNAPTITAADFEIPDQDPVLDSICRFDYLSCLLTLLHATDGDPHQAFPAFAGFYQQRTAPVAAKLVSLPTMRRELDKGADDADWARAIRSLDEVAAEQAMRISWHDWRLCSLPAIQTFVTESAP